MKKKINLIKTVSLLLTFVTASSAFLYAENNWIEIDTMKISFKNLPQELKGLRIVHLSDIHLTKESSAMIALLDKVKLQNPDLIVLTGDIINYNADPTTCGLATLGSGLSAIAPTYAIAGNHDFRRGQAIEWTRILKEQQVHVLNQRAELFTKNGKSLIIAGIQDSALYKTSIFSSLPEDATTQVLPIILLAHHPEYFEQYAEAQAAPIPDLVLSGHAHGGQCRIPISNQGLFAPGQGMMPRYSSGIYELNGVKMVLSRGLGKSTFPQRLNNRPHLPVIILE